MKFLLTLALTVTLVTNKQIDFLKGSDEIDEWDLNDAPVIGVVTQTLE